VWQATVGGVYFAIITQALCAQEFVILSSDVRDHRHSGQR